MIRATNRKAISSIIGSAVFLVLMISGFATFLFAMDVSSDRFSEQLSSSFEESLRGKERFSFTPSVNSDNELFVRVDNQGTESINVVNVWISNPDNTYEQYEVAFQDSHIAPNEQKQVLTNHPDNLPPTGPIVLDDGTYNVKVVTELGTSLVKKLIAPLDPLFADLIVTPQHIGNGHNATVSLYVYNRGNATVYNISPDDSTTDMTDPFTSIEESTGPVPSTINALEPQESAVFAWDMQLIGAIGTQTEFRNTVSGTDSISGSTVTSNEVYATLEFVPTPISLVQRPDISLLVPSPAGEAGSNSVDPLWGVNVSNPTTFPITVSRVILTAAPNSQDVTMFTKNCNTTDIQPGSGTWSCPANNVLMWQNISDPITILERSTQEFLAQTDSATIGAGLDDPATLISATVYSNYGPATKGGVVAGLVDGNSDGTVVSIFGTNSDNTTLPVINTATNPDTLNNSRVIGNIKNIASGSLFALNMTVAVLGDNGNSGVESGRIVINVPSGFEVTQIIDANNAFSAELDNEVEFSDGSHQVSGTFTNLGASNPQAITVKLRLTAPTVTTDALYTVFAMAEGITEASAEHPIGPIVEFPLQIKDCCP